jgi:ubiquitin-protein ligase
MSNNARTERLRREYDALVATRAASTILDFQTQKDPPEHYTVTFRGRSACRASAAHGGVEVCEVQRVEIRLPFSYPASPPDVRWLTPLFHPNVSYGGFLSLRELGIEWNSQVTLDALCERLWDAARFAYVNSHDVINHTAQKWLDEQQERHDLPLDPRPLRDVPPTENPNVVRYTRRDGHKLVLPAARETTEILFIGEDTPTPRLPTGRGDDEVFYIGDE